MVRHLVLLRWSDAVHADRLEEHNAEVVAALAGLPGRLPHLRAYRFGPDLGEDDGNWDFAISADFDDLDGYRTYRDDPVHRSIIERLIRPHLAARAAAQFELD